MSTTPSNLTPPQSHEHPPFLAHHYDTPEQQFQSGKLGMWIFLATEILMFGGLFCAYAVYRHNHPAVFEYAHQYLDKNLGALNTIVLITSSLTMAWAVRLAQTNKRRGLILCLALTLLGGFTFMGVKAVEYHAKWKHHLWVGSSNIFSQAYKGPANPAHLEHEVAHEKPDQAAPAHPTENQKSKIENPPDSALSNEQALRIQESALATAYIDPNTGTPDEPRIKPPFTAPPGLTDQAAQPHAHTLRYSDLAQSAQKRLAIFFSIYFLMTGLHGFHVLVGMGLITWILLRSLRNEFSSAYFAPVDFVGLYWHLVDLIWIFLFPLLYLIH